MSARQRRQSNEIDSVNCATSAAGPVAKRPLRETGEVLEPTPIPTGNRLEALKGARKGQHSIRINDQWRICFRWREGNAFDVEIVDYH